MPNRIIREGINTSARINALSGGAELFYRRLMCVVDDYGRYYGLPTTLRVAAWPTCPEKHTDAEAELWLAELTGGPHPLLRRYAVDGVPYIEFTGFGQRIQTRAKFPAPGGDPREIHGGSTVTHGKSTVDHGGTTETHGEKLLRGEGEGEGEGEGGGGSRIPPEGNPGCGNVENVENSAAAPPPPLPDKNTRKTPPRARSAAAMHSAGEIAASIRIPEERTPPLSEPPPEAEHTDAEILRESLDKLSRLVKLPPPDDGIIARILEACRGAPGIEIHAAIRKLYNSHRLNSMNSWGLLPLILADRFRDYVRDETRKTA